MTALINEEYIALRKQTIIISIHKLYVVIVISNFTIESKIKGKQ